MNRLIMETILKHFLSRQVNSEEEMNTNGGSRRLEWTFPGFLLFRKILEVTRDGCKWMEFFLYGKKKG